MGSSMTRKILGLLVMCASLSAHAATDSALRVWRDMKYGLFVHYVYGGENGGKTRLSNAGGYPVSIDDLVGRFNVSKWADDVKSMGYEYVIFTAWHANMNILYPSPVMDRWRGKGHSTSSRDLLGEVIDTLGARGIKVALYTCIINGHDFHPSGAPPGGGTWFKEGDSVGTNATQDQINTGFWPAARKGATAAEKVKWNNFINEVYDELFGRYKNKVFLLWGDCAWTSTLDYPRWFATIRKHAPDILFLRNAAAGGGFDVGCKELSSPLDTYGMKDLNPDVKTQDMTTWPAYSNSVAFIQGGYWWAWAGAKARYSGETIYRYTILDAAVSTGGGVSWSIGTFADGTWENGVLDSMRRANALLTSVRESWKNTLPSTSFVTAQGARIETLPGGFVATKSRDEKTEYVHVLRAPTGDTLRLPVAKDGKRFEQAQLLPSLKTVSVTSDTAGTLLKLPSGARWDTLNTVIRLRMAEVPRVGSLERSLPRSVSGRIEGNTLVVEGVEDAEGILADLQGRTVAKVSLREGRAELPDPTIGLRMLLLQDHGRTVVVPVVRMSR